MKVERGRRGERGATLVLVALLISVMLLVVALVIDYGFVRNSRQDSKATADTAVAAGLQALATSDGVIRPWSGVCTAFSYLQANERGRSFDVTYTNGSTPPVEIVGDPCATDAFLDQVCVPNTPTSWARIEATVPDYSVEIVSGYRMPDSRFPEDADAQAYGGDNGNSARGGCDQLATIITRREDAKFGDIAGSSGYGTVIRSVGRVRIDAEGKNIPAFLMLERKACEVLSQQVGSGGGIIVEPVSATEPGIIHIDSSGRPCSGSGNNAGAYTVFSDTLSSGPGIRVLGVGSTATTPVRGILSLRGLTPEPVGRPESAVATEAGVYGERREGGVISRQPVDDKYNPSGPAPLTPTITNLHATSVQDAVRTDRPDDTWHQVTTCNNHTTAGDDLTATKIFVKCPDGYSPSNATFTAAREIVFNGPVDVPNGASLFMPAARRIVVGGTSSGGLFVTGTGRLGINSNAFTATDTESVATRVQQACVGREGPAVQDFVSMTVFGGATGGSTPGALNVGGYSAMCQTSVYLAGPKTSGSPPTETTYERQTSVDTSYDPTCVITLTESTPCPKDSALEGANLIVRGYAVWSAPNRSNAPVPLVSLGLEDLALWSESSTGVTMGNSATLQSQGVFFVPNGHVIMRAPSSLSPRDAQFIAKSLKLLQGTLQMKPTQGNAVEFKLNISRSLVR